MKPIHFTELLALAALWGGSFLFMRMGAADFGPVALAFIRVIGASALLLPLLACARQMGALRQHWRAIFLLGLINSALPFILFSYAALSLTTGLLAVFNASSSLFSGAIAWWWLKDRLSPPRLLGLVIGFAGVLWLVLEKASFGNSSGHGGTWAILACLGATLSYGYSACFTKRYLTGVPSMALAAGSQLSATVFLAIPAWIWWPTQAPSAMAWTSAIVLAVLCTGVAYILFFRLIENVGPANAMLVTFLIPVFAAGWGWLFLGEGITWVMVMGCAVILFGTSLTASLLRLPSRPPADNPASRS